MEKKKNSYSKLCCRADVYVAFCGSVEACVKMWEDGSHSAETMMAYIRHCLDEANARLDELRGVSTVDTDKEGGHG